MCGRAGQHLGRGEGALNPTCGEAAALQDGAFGPTQGPPACPGPVPCWRLLPRQGTPWDRLPQSSHSGWGVGASVSSCSAPQSPDPRPGLRAERLWLLSLGVPSAREGPLLPTQSLLAHCCPRSPQVEADAATPARSPHRPPRLFTWRGTRRSLQVGLWGGGWSPRWGSPPTRVCPSSCVR